MNIESSTLRIFWTIVDDMPCQDMLSLSDTALVSALMQRVSKRVLLNGEQVIDLYGYIGTKLHLLRDIASFRCPLGEYVKAG